MAALTDARNTEIRKGVLRSFSLAVTTAYAGGIAFQNASGFAEPATSATGRKILGMFERTVDNSSGNAGDEQALVRNDPAETYAFADGEAPAAATRQNIGDAVYAEDDQTVVLEATGRSRVGVIDDVDAEGIHVRFD